MERLLLWLRTQPVLLGMALFFAWLTGIASTSVLFLTAILAAEPLGEHVQVTVTIGGGILWFVAMIWSAASIDSWGARLLGIANAHPRDQLARRTKTLFQLGFWFWPSPILVPIGIGSLIYFG